MIGILKAWARFFLTKPTTEEKRRAGICKPCPFSEHSKFLDIIKGKVEEVRGLYCNDCGCALVAKIKTKDEKHICRKWR